MSMSVEHALSMPMLPIKRDNIAGIQIVGRESISEPGALAWAPNGFAWSDGKLIKLLRQGQRCNLNLHTSYVSRLVFSPDAKQLISGSHDFTARVWDVDLCAERLIISDHGNMVLAVACSLDGALLATAASEERSVRLRDAQTGQILFELTADGADSYTTLVFSPDGSKLVAADLAAKVWLWDLAGKIIQGVGTHKDMVMDVAFSPDGRLIASASQDGTLRLSDSSLSASYYQFEIGEELFCVAFHPTGKFLVAGDITGRIHFLDVETRQVLFILNEHTKPITDLAFNPTGTLLASVSTDNSLILWGCVE